MTSVRNFLLGIVLGILVLDVDHQGLPIYLLHQIKTLQTATNSQGISLQLQKQNFGLFGLIKNTDTEIRVSRFNFCICNSWCGFFRVNFCISTLLDGLLELFSVSVMFGRVSKIAFCICNVQVDFPDLVLYKCRVRGRVRVPVLLHVHLCSCPCTKSTGNQ